MLFLLKSEGEAKDQRSGLSLCLYKWDMYCSSTAVHWQQYNYYYCLLDFSFCSKDLYCLESFALYCWWPSNWSSFCSYTVSGRFLNHGFSSCSHLSSTRWRGDRSCEFLAPRMFCVIQKSNSHACADKSTNQLTLVCLLQSTQRALGMGRVRSSKNLSGRGSWTF